MIYVHMSATANDADGMRIQIKIACINAISISINITSIIKKNIRCLVANTKLKQQTVSVKCTSTYVM